MDGITPATIVDTPFPLITGGFTPAVGQSTDPVTSDSGAITPTTHLDQKFPQAIIAQETLSSTLDTERKRIMADYTFEQLGAIQMGQFSQGVSGEVDLSKDGITAKNINGDTTFDLNAATGDATFRGTVEASGFTIADENGLVSLSNFEHQQAQGFTSSDILGDNAFVDIPSTTLTTTNFLRPKFVLFSTTILIMLNQTAAGDMSGSFELLFGIDGNGYGAIIEGGARTGTDNNNTGVFLTLSASFVLQLAAGVHTIKLVGRVGNPGLSGASTNMQASVSSALLDYLVIGN